MTVGERYLSRLTILPLPEGAGWGEGERAQTIDYKHSTQFYSGEILVALGVLACGLWRRLAATSLWQMNGPPIK